MKKIVQQLASLIDLKSLITILVIGTLCFLAISQSIQIPSELFAAVVSAIITYFFTKKPSGGDSNADS